MPLNETDKRALSDIDEIYSTTNRFVYLNKSRVNIPSIYSTAGNSA